MCDPVKALEDVVNMVADKDRTIKGLRSDVTMLYKKNAALWQALSMIGPPICECLHHEKKDHHESGPCPVEARINDLIREGAG